MFAVYNTKKERPTLKEAQEYVGGMVQIVYCPSDPDAQLLVNEEGLLLDLPWNDKATDLAKTGIVGNAIFLKGDAKWD
mgnify:FL=1|jgi:hypothetical protein|tara:strand:- start:301 stop:534 length:234 start_codon:yes stop_codon:yes gene_type:complete